MAQQRWRAVTIAIALGAASPAAADALQYQAPEVPEGCPDELAFRQALRRELPASATDDRGGARFVATVETDGAAWTATLVVETDGRGAIVARLVDTTCEAAVTRLAAATVLAVRAAPAPEPARPVPIDPDRVRAVRIGVAGGYGRNAISNGGVFDLDATYGDDARLGGWLRIAGSSRDLSSNTSETATEAAIGVGACFHRRFLEICLRAGGGMLHLNRTSFQPRDLDPRLHRRRGSARCAGPGPPGFCVAARGRRRRGVSSPVRRDHPHRSRGLTPARHHRLRVHPLTARRVSRSPP